LMPIGPRNMAKPRPMMIATALSPLVCSRTNPPS
jgi:hypothetical protein